MPKKKKPKPTPDAFHRHEALHMASVIFGLVDRELIEAEAVKANEEWSRQAKDIYKRLFDLYNAIGLVHLNSEQSDDDRDGTPSV